MTMEPTIPKSTEKPFVIAPGLMIELQVAVERVGHGVRDLEAMRRAGERMDRMREATFEKHGLLDIGVPAIRELRDGE